MGKPRCVRAKFVTTETKETKAAEAKSVEMKPARAKSPRAKSAETKSTEAKSARVKSAEAKCGARKRAKEEFAAPKSAKAKIEKPKIEKAKTEKTKTEKSKTVVRRQIFSGFRGQLKSTSKEAVAAAFLTAIGNYKIRQGRRVAQWLPHWLSGRKVVGSIPHTTVCWPSGGYRLPRGGWVRKR